MRIAQKATSRLTSKISWKICVFIAWPSAATFADDARVLLFSAESQAHKIKVEVAGGSLVVRTTKPVDSKAATFSCSFESSGKRNSTRENSANDVKPEKVWEEKGDVAHQRLCYSYNMSEFGAEAIIINCRFVATDGEEMLVAKSAIFVGRESAIK